MAMFPGIALLALVAVSIDAKHAPKTAVLDEATATLSTEQARWNFSIRNMRAHGSEGRAFTFTGGNALQSGFCNLASPLGLTVNGISWSKLQMNPETVRRFSAETGEGVEFTLCFDGAFVNLRASMKSDSPTLDWEIRPLTTGSRPVTNLDVRVSAIPSHLRTGKGRFFGYRRQVRTDRRLLPPQKSGKIPLRDDERLFILEDAEFDGTAEDRGHGPSAVLVPESAKGYVALNDSWITEVHFTPDPAKPLRFSLFECPGRRLSNAEFEKAAAAVAVGTAPAAPTLHVVGGTEKFRSFLGSLGAVRVEFHPSAEALPIERAGTNDVFFILPDYAHGRQTVEELPFERLTELRAAMDRGAGFYFENYVTPDAASDGRHADLTGLQVVGRPRHLHQEYLVADFGKGTDLGEILQARDAYYLPTTRRSEGVFASVSDCVGTHRVSVPGKWTYPVLARGRTPRVVSGAFDLSRFDPLYRRPRAEWRALVTRMLAAVTGLQADRIAAAFDAAYPEPLRLSRGTDAAAAVRRAVEWHFKSGVMRAADGSKGIFEMIRSNDLGVRKSLRTDVALLTAALLADAGRKYGKPEWMRAGCALADFQLAQGAQAPGGFFRWYAGCDAVYASDSSRVGLALVNLHRATGEKRYRDAALRLGDALVGWLGTNGVCSGCFDLKHGYEGLDLSDNPVFYGEMVPFLLQLGTPRHRAAAERVVDRVMAKFPDVTPFGFSDNFTYSRGLLMLAAAQCLTARDHSEKINRMLDFFIRLRHPCGGIAEAPIRLEEHTEAGVGMGDGSDAITDILYCDYVVYGAASILKRLPAARRGSIDLAKVRLLADGLRDFFLATQIASDDPRFDGGWMRAYDMARGEYYGLNRDMDWGSSCIMGGWVMSFVPALLMCEDAACCW